MNLFSEIHKDIPREGPGNNESTRKAYNLIKNYVSEPHILDIGCGPGMQTIELGSLTDGTILATDMNEEFLTVLSENAKKYGLSQKIKIEKADMKNLPYQARQFDVIWSEGAIFIMGFENGLREWRKFLKQSGILVVSELSWIKENAPKEAVDFWMDAYPAADTVEGNIQKAINSGYEVIDSFVIPESAWWDHYYDPLEKRLSQFSEKYKKDEEALKTIADMQYEIELFRKYHEYYGYVFYLLRLK
jgi:ubiquinone/menaquinone biosynthesis C-methylase UbiE